MRPWRKAELELLAFGAKNDVLCIGLTRGHARLREVWQLEQQPIKRRLRLTKLRI